MPGPSPCRRSNPGRRESKETMVGTVLPRIVIVLLTMGMVGDSSAENEWEGHDWVNAHFGTALEILFPESDSEGVTYRAHRDLYYEQHEYFFVLGHDYNWESFVATVRKPRKSSIWEQLSQLHESEPSASLDQLLQKVQIDTWHLQYPECPEIRTVLEALIDLRVPIHGRIEGIVLHPWVREIRANGSVADFDVTVTLDEHPLARWAEDARAKLDRCIDSPASAD